MLLNLSQGTPQRRHLSGIARRVKGQGTKAEEKRTERLAIVVVAFRLSTVGGLTDGSRPLAGPGVASGSFVGEDLNGALGVAQVAKASLNVGTTE